MDKNDETMAKAMLSDVTQIDRLQTELSDLERRIQTQTSKLAPGVFSRCLFIYDLVIHQLTLVCISVPLLRHGTIFLSYFIVTLIMTAICASFLSCWVMAQLGLHGMPCCIYFLHL